MSKVSEDIELSVVVLCYHSENIIEKFVEQLISELTELNVIYELVLVANYDKNSDDNTPVLAAKLAQKYNSIKVLAHEKEGGMGWDMRSGLSAATGKYIAVIDGSSKRLGFATPEKRAIFSPILYPGISLNNVLSTRFSVVSTT